MKRRILFPIASGFLAIRLRPRHFREFRLPPRPFCSCPGAEDASNIMENHMCCPIFKLIHSQKGPIGRAIRKCASIFLPILLFSSACEAATVLNQIGDANSYSFETLPAPTPSQIFTDFPDFDCTVIEEFTVTSSQLRITQVSALFQALGGFSAFQDVQGYFLNFYDDPALAAASLTGNVASLTLAAGSGASVTQVVDGSGAHEYGLVNLDLDVALPSAGKYWVGVSPIASSSVAGQFLVQTSNSTQPQTADARFANPAQGFGNGALLLLGNHYAYSVTAVPEPEVGAFSLILLCGSLCSRSVARKRR